MTPPSAARIVTPLLAVAAGLCLLAAHPPIGWWWATFLHPALLVAALWTDRLSEPVPDRRLRRGFGVGFVVGLTAFAPLLSWLINAPAGVLGWALLALVQAGWYGVLGIALTWVLERTWFPLFGAALWTGVEAWRGLVPLNGFEWGSIAYAHVDGSWMVPIARLVGGRGITFLVVLISIAAAVAVRTTWRQVRGRDGANIERELTATTRVPLGLLVGGVLISILATIGPPPTDGTLDILVVQGHDIRQWEESVPDRPLHVTTNMRDETIAAIGDGPTPDLTVWPESSIDRDFTTPRGASLAPLVEDAVRVAGELIAGATMDAPDTANERYITAVRFDGSLDEQERYTKRRLVPFGEFIPARPLLEWFPPLEQVPRDAIPGDAPTQLTTTTGVPLAVIICFETLFTDVVRQNVMAGDTPAALILSLTNDASFGDSAEPAQHLAQSQLRAIETGRWVVHGALSGSSAFIDPDGTVYDSTELFETDSIRRQVPLATGVTPYLVIGDVLGWLTRLSVLGLALIMILARRRPPEEVPASTPSKDRTPASAVEA